MQTLSPLLRRSIAAILVLLLFVSCDPSATDFTGNTIQHEDTRKIEIDSLFLKAQVEILAKKEIQKMKEFGLDKIPNLRVLDVGCGPGYFSVELLKQFPNIQEVVCMEIDPLFVQFAKQKVLPSLNREFRNKLTVVQGSIFDSSEFTSRDNFDLVIARLVYQHIRKFGNVEVATKNLMSALKPGGRIILTDSDAKYADIIEPALEKWSALNEEAEQYLNPDKVDQRDKESGRKLYLDLKPFVTGLTIDVVTGVVDDETKHWFPYVMDMMDYKLLVKKQLVHEETYREADEEMREWIKNPNSFAVTVVFLVSGQKPDVTAAVNQEANQDKTYTITTNQEQPLQPKRDEL